MHPYVGLAVTINNEHSPAHGQDGTIASVTDGFALVLLYGGAHECMSLSGLIVADPAEARRRLVEWSGPDRWQPATTTGPGLADPPTKSPPDGYEPIGAWQPFASGDSWTDWRRPLRKLPGEVSGG